MRIPLLLASCVLCLSTIAFAQSNLPQATKVDEFGDVYPTDMAARLDNFAIQLQNEPDKLGFLIVYRSHRDVPGISRRHVEWMQNYLVALRGIPENRIKTVDGGSASCLWHELWILPPGSAPAPRTDAYSRGFEDASVARKYDEYYWDAPHDLPGSFGTEYSDSLEGFADALRKQPKAIAYIIGYAEYELLPREDQNRRGTRARIDPPGTVGKELGHKRSRLNKLGIPATRIKTVNGGYRNWRSLELWILPRGALAPIPTPNVVPKRQR